MRKLFLLVVIVMAAISASAQEGVYLGGGISLWRNNDVDKTSFSITPDVGYNLSKQWAVGVELAYAHKGYDGELEVSSNAFALAPYARYSFYENKIVRLFLDMGFGFSTYKAKHADSVNGFEIGVKPGLALKLNDHFSFITKVGFAGYRDDYYRDLEGNGFGVGLDMENISIGIDYEF
ncbi:MAG TPA: porin family protein [Bacteroides mediterraneensis]|uniref:outer membrane beta-barrel protein n=1 Tax=Bacteroides mediterraneensis TaxID=1841856 RepID=UPI00093516B3|nr:outer membrane beta-barrel protein [Bacteroides mediterraneensis]HJH63134.1 porin family protein [Bacteroides mediterraneensis]